MSHWLLLFFWKSCFNLRTSYTELIWCSNGQNAHNCTFYKRWSFIWVSLTYLTFNVFFSKKYHYFQYQQLIRTLLVSQKPEKFLTSVQEAFGLPYNFHPKQTKKELNVRNSVKQKSCCRQYFSISFITITISLFPCNLIFITISINKHGPHKNTYSDHHSAFKINIFINDL